MRSFFVLVMVLSVGCGRFSFSEAPDGGDGRDGGDGDAALPGSPMPAHRYKLAGSFADEAGGMPLIGMGGALDASLGYKFEANKGLRLSGVMPLDVYTVDIRFTFHDIGACNPTGYHFCKLLDFKDLSVDEGLYVFDEKLHFVISTAVSPALFAESTPLFSADGEATVTLTRAADGRTDAYVNRQHVFFFMDTTAMAKFSRGDHVAHFAVDDRATVQGEASSGSIREIAIWNVALTPEQIAALP